MQGRTVDIHPAMLATLADAEDDSTEPYWKDDPLYGQDILGMTKEALRDMMHTDQEHFRASLAELNDEELAYLTKLFEQGGAAATGQ
jgi:hypothetical protein